MKDKLLEILNKCDLSLNNLDDLENKIIQRDNLIKAELYERLKDDILNMKTEISSSFFTCVQKNAGKKQKWPLVNFIRQILKLLNYKMIPIRKCNGYTKDGKKKYIRYYKIIKVEEKV